MTPQQKIMALEAALCACESVIDPQKAQEFVAYVDTLLEPIIDSYPIFGDFLDAQLEAVHALAKSPETFGH